jgi:hypothetical protein
MYSTVHRILREVMDFVLGTKFTNSAKFCCTNVIFSYSLEEEDSDYNVNNVMFIHLIA